MQGFDLQTITDCRVGNTPAQAIYYGSNLIWPMAPHDYSHDYLTIVSLEDNNSIKWFTQDEHEIQRVISVSTNNGLTWGQYNSTASDLGPIAVLNTGDKLLIKGNNSYYATIRSTYFSALKRFNIEGNIMSLIYGDNFIGQTVLDSTGSNFEGLFYHCQDLVSAENLILPATTLTSECYKSMFAGCTSLTTAPELHATTLAKSCYKEMFYGCSSLTTAPELPVTTLAQSCYSHMFYGCTALTTAPELPATTLATDCYDFMFQNCSSLTTAPELPATTLAGSCYSSMFSGCTSLTAVPALPATTLTNYCYAGMFKNCSSLTTAPVLPATTLTSQCYQYMFYGCTSLNYIKCLAINNINTNSSTQSWVTNVSATGTFVRDSNATWPIGDNGIPSGWTVDPPIQHDYSQDYLTIVSLADSNIIGWKASNANLLKTISVSTNDGSTWTSYTSDTTGVTLATLNNGDKLLVKGSNTAYATSSYYNYFTSTNNFDVEGNIMSLLYGDNFANQTTLDSAGYNLKNLFNNCTKLISAENLILPATTLATYCYYYMFQNCTSLTTAPVLPATTLAEGCYQYMFMNCTSLTTAPELPATTLANYCYGGMFWNCTSLTTAPELPATTLATYCYYYMFQNCTSLTTAPVLLATTLANNCYQNMFQGCTSLTTAPELPATTLADSCYKGMFGGCTSLNYVECYATDISAANCTAYWLNNVASTGTFKRSVSNTNWLGGPGGIPETWTVDPYMQLVHDKKYDYLTIVSLENNNTIGWICYSINFAKSISVSTDDGLTWTNYTSAFTNNIATLNTGDKLLIKGINTAYATSQYYNYFTSTGRFSLEGNIMSLTTSLFATSTSASSYAFKYLFRNCSKLVSAADLLMPATTLNKYCYQGMFSACSSLTTAPELPATTLANNCYQNMFSGCTSLNYIKCLATDISASSCTSNWTNIVPATGTFVKNASMSSWTTGNNGIPTGWTVQNAS